MAKRYELGVVCGRFQHFHNGHKAMVDKAFEVAEKVLILVGSSQESGTDRNPFSYETRAKLIHAVYPTDAVTVAPLPDMTTEDDIRPEWGRYVLAYIKRYTGRLPDALVYGDDENRRGWFAAEDIKDVHSVVISHNTIPIHATELRTLLVNNRFFEWREFVPVQIHPLFHVLQQELGKVAWYRDGVKISSRTIVLYRTNWLELRQSPEGYVYTHDPWCNSVGVAILPYRMDDGQTRFLGRVERRPAHGGGAGLYAITGGYDNSERFTIEECALNELREEGGYAGTARELTALGSVHLSKTSDVVMHLFAIDVENLATCEAEGDGTEMEKNDYCQWVSVEELIQSQDPLLLAMLTRLTHLH